MTTGALIILTGPSGVGKGVLRRGLFQALPWLKEAISVTTRPPRPQEVNGIDYFFVSQSEFEAMVADDQFVEWATFAGHSYGTPHNQLESAIETGDAIVLEIELQGARAIRLLFPEAFLIFIAPPSLEALAERLRQRKTDSEAAIAERLETASEEMEAQAEFDHIVINDDLTQAQTVLNNLVESLVSLSLESA